MYFRGASNSASASFSQRKKDIEKQYAKAQEPFKKFKILSQQLIDDEDVKKSDKSDSEWGGEG